MKTTYSQNDIENFLRSSKSAEAASIRQLQEGHISQTYYFENTTGQRLVLRIAPWKEDFLHDQYAHEKLGDILPVPKVLEVGSYTDDSFYCISEYIDGVPSNTIKQSEIDSMQPKILELYAGVFRVDVSDTSGYGLANSHTGEGKFASWRQKLTTDLGEHTVATLRSSASNIGLDPDLVDAFIAQAKTNLPFASEVRRLLHGDLGFDNLLINDGEVVALIDWAKIGYGDWMEDFAKFDFWWMGRHGLKQDFAKQYSLDSDHLSEREALYWATTALATINFADRFKDEMDAQWLRDNIESKITA